MLFIVLPSIILSGNSYIYIIVIKWQPDPLIKQGRYGM